MLDSGVILESIARQVFAIAGVLEATVGHFSHHRDVGVNPDAAEIEGLCHPHRPTMIFGPDA